MLSNDKLIFVFYFIITKIAKIYPAQAGHLRSAHGPHARATARDLDSIDLKSN